MDDHRKDIIRFDWYIWFNTIWLSSLSKSRCYRRIKFHQKWFRCGFAFCVLTFPAWSAETFTNCDGSLSGETLRIFRGFFTPPVAGADLVRALIIICFRGFFPWEDLWCDCTKMGISSSCFQLSLWLLENLRLVTALQPQHHQSSRWICRAFRVVWVSWFLWDRERVIEYGRMLEISLVTMPQNRPAFTNLGSPGIHDFFYGSRADWSKELNSFLHGRSQHS